MENVNRSSEYYRNRIIYRMFTKNDIENLSDEEFKALQNSAAPRYSTLPHVERLYYDFFAGLDSGDLQGNGDRVDMRIYQRKVATELSHLGCYDRYIQLFGFSMALGIKNIYDIGCGHQLQAFLLTFAPDVNYVGIDDQFQNSLENFEVDPDYITDLFRKITATDRFEFKKSTYPCELEIKQGNIAIAIAVCCNLKSSNQKDTLKRLGCDFERIIFDINKSVLNTTLTAKDIPDIISRKIDMWYDPTDEFMKTIKELLPEFEIFSLGGKKSNYIFATKFKEDIGILNEKFIIAGDKITTGLFDLKYTNLIDFQPVE